MNLPISIIVPTFNEGLYLPKLLQSLQNQTKKPTQTIVADAFSLDNTRQIAKSFGCMVVDGGLPSVARNRGVKFATQPILLFLDADVDLPPYFLERTFTEMVTRNLDIASCFIIPKSSLRVDHLLHLFANHYMKLTQRFHPHVPGCCIFVKKDVHQAIGGFDESLILSEDHDYVRRAKKVGRFDYLKSYKIPVSVRRLSAEGRIKIALKYIAIELHLIFIGNIRRNIFKYRFGHYYKLFKDA
ncbi:glycosyltransferase [Candidatus Daviesbacteria bacterium]|nr:glycosyltransferase [Candidatus Daviesbacteria bacterium]